MKIKTIAVSNIRSFRYNPDFEDEINFETAGLNLLIGPNASGKSNLMEIIMRIFSNIYDITGANAGNYDTNLSGLVSNTTVKHQLPNRNGYPGTFTRHRSAPENTSSIKLELTIDQKDRDNLKFIQNKKSTLTALYQKYFQEIPGSSHTRIFDSSYAIPTAGTVFEIIIDEHKEQHSSYFLERNPEELIVRYLRDYGLICALIDIHNELLNPDTFMNAVKSNPTMSNYQSTVDALGITARTNALKPLKPPMILMSVQERLADINLTYFIYNGGNGGADEYGSSYRHRQYARNLAQKSTQGGFTGNTSDTFDIVKGMVWQEVAELMQSGVGIRDTVKQINAHNQVIKQFNNFVSHFRLKLKLANISIEKGKLEFIVEESKTAIEMLDMSSGQRAILNIASSLTVGNELKALVLVDEIENHLHPTIQARLRDALIEIAKEGSQSIAVTHSPVFVSVQTLRNTIRLYMREGYTHAKKCHIALTKKNKAIFEILEYTNGARVFFAEKVVLVEGSSDQELFTAYLRKRLNNNEIEVIRTGSDDGLKKWRKIIKSFDVRVWTLGDLDNALKPAQKSEIKRLRNIPDNVSITWEDIDPSEHNNILRKIEIFRQDGRFILKKGALESYVPGDGNKNNRARDFIADNDWTKLNHKAEIREIFLTIIKA